MIGKPDPQLTPDSVYQLVAEVGFQKYFHLDGFQATKTLLDRLEITADTNILEVGCATGKTACYIAKNYGCNIVGIDLLEGMVTRGNERAARENVAHLVTFRQADAQDLPFEDDQFDLLLSEFVTGLLEDKTKGLLEYIRVVKPGGTLAFNEATWIKFPPPPDLVYFITQVFGVRSELLHQEGWIDLLTNVGIKELTHTIHQAQDMSNPREDLKDVIKVFPKMVSMVLRDPLFRKFIRTSLAIPKDITDYFGYGLYVGKVYA